MLIVLASTLSLSLSSCYSSQLYVGGMEVDEPKRVFNSKTNNHFLFGLISPASNKKDIKQYVGDRQKYAIKNHHTFLNGFLERFFGGYNLWYLYSIKNYILCTYK